MADTNDNPGRDRDKLEGLRMSVARVAQRLGLDAEIPGGSPAGYDELVKACREDKGWHTLVGKILDRVEAMADMAEAVARGLGKR